MDKAGTLPPKEEAVYEKQEDDESIETFDASSLIIIPVNDESKKIRQIFSNETSMKILEILKQESLSLSELSERLDIPLTTVKYNLDILVENDLVNIKRIKYSEKGRQVKIYEAPEKVIVFAPEKMSRFSLIAMLQKYAFALVAAGLLGVIFNSLYFRYVLQQSFGGNTRAGDGMEFVTPAPMAPPTDSGLVQNVAFSFSDWIFSILTHYSVWFITGAIITCALILVIDYILVKREN